MSTQILNNQWKKLKLPLAAVLLAIYVIWEIVAILFDYSDASSLCPAPSLLIAVAAISILLFMKKRGIILLIPFGLLAITYIVNILDTAIGTYNAYFPLDNSSMANAMRLEYFCNILVLVIDFAISTSIILLLITNTRKNSSKSKKNVIKYTLLVLVIVRILFFLFYYLRATLDVLIYMPIDFAAYFLLTPFIYYIGLLLCGFQIVDAHKNTGTNETTN